MRSHRSVSTTKIIDTINKILNDESLPFVECVQQSVNFLSQSLDIDGASGVQFNIDDQIFTSEKFLSSQWKFGHKTSRDKGTFIEISVYFESKERSHSFAQKDNSVYSLHQITQLVADKVYRIKKQDVLFNKEERFRLLAENSIDVIWTMDPLMNFKYVSPSIYPMFGYTQEEWIGTNLSQHASRKEFLKMAGQAFKAMRNYKKFSYVIFSANMLKKSGEEIPVEIIGRLLLNKVGIPIGLQGSTRDITERVNSEKNIQESEKMYLNSVLKLYEAGKHLGESLDLQQVYENLYRILSKQIPCDGMIVASFDKDKKEFICESMWNEGTSVDVSDFPAIPLEPAGKGTQSRVIHEKKSLIINDFQSYQHQTNTSYYVDKKGIYEEEIPEDIEITNSAILVPLFRENEIIGVVQATSYELDAYTEEHLKFLEALSPQISAAISNAVLHEESEQARKILQQSLEGTIFTLAKMIETRDPYTAGHQIRVAELSVAIARELNLSESSITGLRMAAIVHDIGKINIPIEILSKPGTLSKMEFALIKMHPKVAYDLLRGIKFPWPIADYILQHHEKIDGSGYPDGLVDTEILFESRILVVADIVEAMSSHRPYRPALGVPAALDEIREQRGKTLDSKVVDACLVLFKNGFKFNESNLESQY